MKISNTTESEIPSTTLNSSNLLVEKTQNHFNFRCPTLPFTQNLNKNANCTDLTHKNINEVSRSECITYYRTLFKHFVIYSNQLLPSLFSIYTSFKTQKMNIDFQKQALCMLDLCKTISLLLPNSGITIKKNCFKLFRKLAKYNDIGNFK